MEARETRLSHLAFCSLAALGLACAPADARAQTTEELQRQIDDLKAAIAALETQLSHRAADSAGPPRETVAPLRVEAKGAPRFSGEGFEGFKIRGRIMADIGQVGDPDRIGRMGEDGFVGDSGLGTTSEIRRSRIGVEGGIEDFKYKLEADFRDEDVEAADVFIEYVGIDNVSIIAGYQKTQASMEEQTSSLSQKFMERGGFTDAFGLGRDLGLTAMVYGENWHWKSGIFSDGGFSGDDEASGIIASSRAHYAFRHENGFTHLGASVEYRDEGAQGSRFRLRPLLHTTDTRLIDTGDVEAGSTALVGGELAGVYGPFNFATEYGGMFVDRRSGEDAFLQGGFAHLGYFLSGEQRGYKMREGFWDLTSPARPLGKGGWGALELNLGVDWVDLEDTGNEVQGGRQFAVLAGLTWIPITHIRVLANFNHVEVDNSPTLVRLAKSGAVSRDFDVEAFSLRAQVSW